MTRNDTTTTNTTVCRTLTTPPLSDELRAAIAAVREHHSTGAASNRHIAAAEKLIYDETWRWPDSARNFIHLHKRFDLDQLQALVDGTPFQFHGTTYRAACYLSSGNLIHLQRGELDVARLRTLLAAAHADLKAGRSLDDVIAELNAADPIDLAWAKSPTCSRYGYRLSPFDDDAYLTLASSHGRFGSRYESNTVATPHQMLDKVCWSCVATAVHLASLTQH